MEKVASFPAEFRTVMRVLSDTKSTYRARARTR
jgi:hypothetical protein